MLRSFLANYVSITNLFHLCLYSMEWSSFAMNTISVYRGHVCSCFYVFLMITKYSKNIAFSISEFNFLKNWSFEKKGRYVLLNWLFYPHICTKSPFLSILCALFWEKIPSQIAPKTPQKISLLLNTI